MNDAGTVLPVRFYNSTTFYKELYGLEDLKAAKTQIENLSKTFDFTATLIAKNADPELNSIGVILDNKFKAGDVEFLEDLSKITPFVTTFNEGDVLISKGGRVVIVTEVRADSITVGYRKVGKFETTIVNSSSSDYNSLFSAEDLVNKKSLIEKLSNQPNLISYSKNTELTKIRTFLGTLGNNKDGSILLIDKGLDPLLSNSDYTLGRVLVTSEGKLLKVSGFDYDDVLVKDINGNESILEPSVFLHTFDVTEVIAKQNDIISSINSSTPIPKVVTTVNLKLIENDSKVQSILKFLAFSNDTNKNITLITGGNTNITAVVNNPLLREFDLTVGELVVDLRGNVYSVKEAFDHLVLIDVKGKEFTPFDNNKLYRLNDIIDNKNSIVDRLKVISPELVNTSSNLTHLTTLDITNQISKGDINIENNLKSVGVNPLTNSSNTFKKGDPVILLGSSDPYEIVDNSMGYLTVHNILTGEFSLVQNGIYYLVSDLQKVSGKIPTIPDTNAVVTPPNPVSGTAQSNPDVIGVPNTTPPAVTSIKYGDKNNYANSVVAEVMQDNILAIPPTPQDLYSAYNRTWNNIALTPTSSLSTWQKGTITPIIPKTTIKPNTGKPNAIYAMLKGNQYLDSQGRVLVYYDIDLIRGDNIPVIRFTSIEDNSLVSIPLDSNEKLFNITQKVGQQILPILKEQLFTL